MRGGSGGRRPARTLGPACGGRRAGARARIPVTGAVRRPPRSAARRAARCGRRLSMHRRQQQETTMNATMTAFARLALLAILPVSGALAQAQSAAPSKQPIRIVIPLPPGTAQDGIARRLADRMASVLGQAVIVDNKPGASGILATDTVVKSPADGSVLSFTMASTISIAPHTFRKLPYDPLRDLKPVIQVGTTPLVLVVNASNPARNLEEFVENARRNPGKVSFGSFGNGTSAHLLGEELNRKA
ncbi:MAG: hypothetical protein EOO24_32590, partial [Comamonadaceae bacterium]